MSIDTVVQVFNDKQEYFSDCRIRGGVKAPGKQLRLNIPFFVDSETGEVEHLFRANWSVIPPRLITRSGVIV